MKNKDKKSKSSIDNFESPDFYNLDDLLTQEHIMIRNSIRDFVKKEISPFIEDWSEKNYFPSEIVRKMGEIGIFGPTTSEK